MAIEGRSFWEALKLRGYTFLAGVPDSTFGNSYNLILNDPEIRYVAAVREDVALGVASAAFFNDRRGAVVMQNSGIGNIINALTSFNLIYKIPVLLVIGWRGYGGPPNDAPEHWIMGEKSMMMLDLLGIPAELVDEENWETQLDNLFGKMDNSSIPGALFIRGGVLS